MTLAPFNATSWSPFFIRQEKANIYFGPATLQRVTILPLLKNFGKHKQCIYILKLTLQSCYATLFQMQKRGRQPTISLPDRDECDFDDTSPTVGWPGAEVRHTDGD